MPPSFLQLDLDDDPFTRSSLGALSSIISQLFSPPSSGFPVACVSARPSDSTLQPDLQSVANAQSTSSLLATYDADHPPRPRRYSFVPSASGPASPLGSPTLSESSLPFATPPRPPKSPRRYSTDSSITARPSFESAGPYSILDRTSLFTTTTADASRPSLDTLIRSELEREKMSTPTEQKLHDAEGGYVTKEPRRRWILPAAAVAALAVIGLALGLGLGLGLKDKNKEDSATSTAAALGDSATSADPTTGGTSTAAAPSATASLAVESRYFEGKTGSHVMLANGKEFVYSNEHGGDWAYDVQSPYNASGKAQSWTPRLNETWGWGRDQMRGVNLGGWLVTEPFIVPGLYEPYVAVDSSIQDEYTLCAHLGDRAARVLEEHYATFITEEDFALIAAAGLNWVRIPIGYWAVSSLPGDPFVEGTSWKYFLKALVWARKYGLRILLDLHALPGSQNGWNHSGRGNGTINWMSGSGGIANAQRSLETLRTLAQFVSQPGIKEVVPILGLVNEVRAQMVTNSVLGSFYYEAYKLIREITGVGGTNGPWIAIHEGFVGTGQWSGFMPGADRMILDWHPYKAFTPDHYSKTWPEHLSDVCSGWGREMRDSSSSFGLTIGGEWSLATTDCGKWLNAVGNGANFGDCSAYEDWRKFDDAMKGHLTDQFMGTADALKNWFFWTWKIGESTELGYAPSPAWHYKLGVEQGWIPKDPRSADGFCASKGLCSDCAFTGTYPANALGQNPSATPSMGSFASSYGDYSAFPPPSIQQKGGAMPAADYARVPKLTQTGTPVVLAMPTEYKNVSGAGDGWANKADNVAAYAEVTGCPYGGQYDVDAFWDGLCAGGAAVPGATPSTVQVPVEVSLVPAAAIPTAATTPAAAPTQEAADTTSSALAVEPTSAAAPTDAVSPTEAATSSAAVAPAAV